MERRKAKDLKNKLYITKDGAPMMPLPKYKNGWILVPVFIQYDQDRFVGCSSSPPVEDVREIAKSSKIFATADEVLAAIPSE